MSLKKYRSGFTIVELLIVVVVLSVISTIVAFNFAKTQSKARDKDRETSALTMMSALEKYYEDNGEYPNASLLNTSQKTKMSESDYRTTVLTAMPSLTLDTLNSAGAYNFYAVYCSSGFCPDTDNTQLAQRSKQFMYVSSRPDQASEYNYPSTNNLWGCKINFDPDNVASSAVLAWRSEATGKWTFYRTKKVQTSISPSITAVSPGPVAPTVCEFTKF